MQGHQGEIISTEPEMGESLRDSPSTYVRHLMRNLHVDSQGVVGVEQPSLIDNLHTRDGTQHVMRNQQGIVVGAPLAGRGNLKALRSGPWNHVDKTTGEEKLPDVKGFRGTVKIPPMKVGMAEAVARE